VPATSTASPQVLAARTAVATVFGLNGLMLASWFARVPAAREALGLSAGELGLLLLALSVGAVLALLTAGTVAHRLGAARTVMTGAAAGAGGLALVGVAAGGWGLVPAVGAGLFAVGYGSGTCEVAMNVEGAAVERRLGRTIMPRFHAAWSLGTVAGAGIGAGFARIDVPIAVHLSLAAVVVAVGTLIAARSFLPPAATGSAPGGPAASGSAAGDAAAAGSAAGAARRGSGLLAAWREPRTILIGLLVLVLAFTEGTANDWLAVAFVDGHQVSEAMGALSFGIFVAAMTFGRTAGTVALDRWGRVRVLWATMALAAAGVAVVVLAGPWPVALVGVALWGLGASLGFPVGMSAAADDERYAAARVSVVAVIGYTAFLAGPPLVGLLGDQIGVLRSLLVVSLLLLPALALVPSIRPPATALPARDLTAASPEMR
jgi:fucose permease